MPSLNLQLPLWDKTTDAQEHPRVCFATVAQCWDNHWETVLMVSLEQMRHKQSAFLWTRHSPSPLVYEEYKTQPPGHVVRRSRLRPAPSALRKCCHIILSVLTGLILSVSTCSRCRLPFALLGNFEQSPFHGKPVSYQPSPDLTNCSLHPLYTAHWS